MHQLLFADGFLTGSLLTLVLPLGLVIAIATWYVIAVRRVPKDTPTSSLTLPPDEVLEAAGPEVIADVTPAEADPDRDPDAGHP